MQTTRPTQSSPFIASAHCNKQAPTAPLPLAHEMLQFVGGGKGAPAPAPTAPGRNW